MSGALFESQVSKWNLVFRRQSVLVIRLVDCLGGRAGPGRMPKASELSCSDLRWIEICLLQSTHLYISAHGLYFGRL